MVGELKVSQDLWWIGQGSCNISINPVLTQCLKFMILTKCF